MVASGMEVALACFLINAPRPLPSADLVAMVERQYAEMRDKNQRGFADSTVIVSEPLVQARICSKKSS
jgi:hypothetical protein